MRKRELSKRILKPGKGDKATAGLRVNEAIGMIGGDNDGKMWKPIEID